MKQTVGSLWIATFIGIAGLMLGYTISLVQTGPSAFARNQCPMHGTDLSQSHS